MKVNGGPWDGQNVDLPEGRVGLALYDRPNDRVWVYDLVPTPDGEQLDVREADGRKVTDAKLFEEDARWARRVLDDAEIEEEVGL